MSSNPLEIAELVDLILGFVGTARDLQASARVNRVWCRSSQAHLFRDLKLPDHRPPSQILRLLQTLQQSGHLAHLIHKLDLFNIQAPLESLGKLSFPSLTSLSVYDSSQFCNEPVLRAINRFVANPALRTVRIFCTFRNEADTARIWHGCSENIRHLSYSFNLLDQTGEAVFREGGARKRITLDSFSGRANTVAEILRWLQDASCPFDLSDLKALQLNEPIDTLVNDIYGPVYGNIQIFSTDPDMLDLSPFRLFQLEMAMESPSTQGFLLLRTIRPENRHHLRTLVLRIFDLSTEGAQEMAGRLAELSRDFPSLTLVHITAFSVSDDVEMHPNEYFRSPDPSITIRWHFQAADFGPWYNKIV
ncbi:hypothetical protein FB45DRAFT_890500 [Roridomyces roridus]|uniref:Uncharacterized protein n=1 Tax=Roridomyces roridus TaxID=1738132 RepID=A0AAD7CLC0_9AGAR|nr:hypothetical protein FB45DRAFT_890500 [Roridomyces roridus]